MSKTPLEVAQAKHAAAIARVQTARDALQVQIAAAHSANAEVSRLKAAIAAGDASEARNLAGAQTDARGQTEAIDAFRQAVAVAERAEQAARLDLVAEEMKTDRGDLLTAAELAELENETRETIDAAAAKLGDAITRHNAALSAGMAQVKEAQAGLAPNVSVLVTESGVGSGFTRTLFIDGQDYREASPTAAIDRAAWRLGGRWVDAANAAAIEAQRAAIEAQRIEDARILADRMAVHPGASMAKAGKARTLTGRRPV